MPRRRAAASSAPCSGSPSPAEPIGTLAPTPTRSIDTMPRTRGALAVRHPVHVVARAVVVVASGAPRGSSAPKATKTTGRRVRRSATASATASITPIPDALSSAPGACGTVSRCAPTTRWGSVGSNSGGVATTFCDRPAGTARRPRTRPRVADALPLDVVPAPLEPARHPVGGAVEGRRSPPAARSCPRGVVRSAQRWQVEVVGREGLRPARPGVRCGRLLLRGRGRRRRRGHDAEVVLRRRSAPRAALGGAVDELRVGLGHQPLQ